MGSIEKWLPEAREADFVLAKETHLPQNSVVAQKLRMRSQGWRAFVLPALHRSPQHGDWESSKMTARSAGSSGSAGMSVVAALRHGVSKPCEAAGECRACACRVAQRHPDPSPAKHGVTT